jgi:predicted HicB family RNase H-like nuclease
MDTMEYKGYRGLVRYSAEDRVFFGEILGIDDLVNFEGANVDELEQAFHEAVDDYLALCAKLGRVPDRAYSGKIPLRVESALHRRIAIAADSAEKSLNSWITEALEAASAPRRATAGKVSSMKKPQVESLEGTGTSARHRRGAKRAAAAKRRKRVRVRKAR